MATKEITLDATGKTYGRLASQVAGIVRGKTSAEFQPNRVPDITLIVTHLDKIKMSGKKSEQKMYYHYSGYPGGLRAKSFHESFSKNAEKTFLNTVRKMLPNNKLRSIMLKHITFK